jgi:hypothetical protein
MATTAKGRSTWSRVARGGLLVAAAAILVFLLAAVAVSPAPMRGAELFGALANKIKGNPGATAAISLGALAALWLGLALLALAQEWMIGRRRAP